MVGRVTCHAASNTNSIGLCDTLGVRQNYQGKIPHIRKWGEEKNQGFTARVLLVVGSPGKLIKVAQNSLHHLDFDGPLSLDGNANHGIQKLPNHW